MDVVWGQVHSIIQWFVINTCPWQHLDQFEEKTFTKVEESKKNSFFLT
jgi:hypothetical protein